MLYAATSYLRPLRVQSCRDQTLTTTEAVARVGTRFSKTITLALLTYNRWRVRTAGSGRLICWLPRQQHV